MSPEILSYFCLLTVPLSAPFCILPFPEGAEQAGTGWPSLHTPQGLFSTSMGLSFPVCTMALGRDRSSRILSQTSWAIPGWDTVHNTSHPALFPAQDPAWPSERRPEDLGVEQELPPAQ